MARIDTKVLYNGAHLVLNGDEIVFGGTAIGTEWVQVANTATGAGQATNLAILNDKIYTATYNGNLLEWNNTDAWVSVADNDAKHVQIGVLNGELYSVSLLGELYKWDGVDTWTTLVTSSNVLTTMYVFDNKIYALKNDGTLLEWDNASSWVAKTSSLSVGYTMVEYNSELYMATFSISGSKMYKWNGINAWTEVATNYNYQMIQHLCVFNDKIYASTNINPVNPETGGTLLEWDSVDEFVQVAPILNGEYALWSLLDYQGDLYAGTGYLYVWNGTNAWEQVANYVGASDFFSGLIEHNSALYGVLYQTNKLFLC